jgi:hypothetical protein
MQAVETQQWIPAPGKDVRELMLRASKRPREEQDSLSENGNPDVIAVDPPGEDSDTGSYETDANDSGSEQEEIVYTSKELESILDIVDALSEEVYIFSMFSETEVTCKSARKASNLLFKLREMIRK